MEALYLLIPISIVLVFAALWIFFRMSDAGQFDDLVGPAYRILQDDDAGRDLPPGPGGQSGAAAATGATAANTPDAAQQKTS